MRFTNKGYKTGVEIFGNSIKIFESFKLKQVTGQLVYKLPKPLKLVNKHLNEYYYPEKRKNTLARPTDNKPKQPEGSMGVNNTYSDHEGEGFEEPLSYFKRLEKKRLEEEEQKKKDEIERLKKEREKKKNCKRKRRKTKKRKRKERKIKKRKRRKRSSEK